MGTWRRGVFEGDGGAHGCAVGGGERGREEGCERERDETVRVWDVETGECLKVMQGHTYVVSVALSGDGKRVVSGSRDRRCAWDVETGECLEVMEGHTMPVFSGGERGRE